MRSKIGSGSWTVPPACSISETASKIDWINFWPYHLMAGRCTFQVLPLHVNSASAANFAQYSSKTVYNSAKKTAITFFVYLLVYPSSRSRYLRKLSTGWLFRTWCDQTPATELLNSTQNFSTEVLVYMYLLLNGSWSNFLFLSQQPEVMLIAHYTVKVCSKFIKRITSASTSRGSLRLETKS